MASRLENWFEAFSQANTVIIFFWTHTHMEPLASFPGHHPDICYLQYET